MRNTPVCILGRHGLLGSAIASRFDNVSSTPSPETRIVFHFASHVHPEFEKNPTLEMDYVLHEFARLLPWCYEHGATFVYPSSALVYEKETQFSRFKKTLEMLAGCYKARTLGLRIFPVYGPQENRTVISKWSRDIAEGRQPEVYGDGNQTRDFIYIDDAVDQILGYVGESRWTSRVVDIGAGVPTTFNEILRTINSVAGVDTVPRYIMRPAGYSEGGVVCSSPGIVKVPLEAGIRKVVESLKVREEVTT